MKFYNIRLLFVSFVLICSCISHAFAQDSDGAAVPAAKRIALRRPAGKAVKATTTTTAAPPAYDDEGDYQDGEQTDGAGHSGEEGENGALSTTTTSTEPPKKVGPVIRPFRSNDDFLNSLKRRQMNAKKHRAEVPQVKPKAKATESSNDDQAEESEPAAAPAAPVKGYKAGNPALSRRKPIKSFKPEPAVEDTAVEETENQKEESKLKRPGRPGLALRKRT